MRAYAVDLRHLDHARRGGPFYICFGSKNLAWTPAEMRKFKALYTDNLPVEEMSARLGRPADEVELLIWDLVERGEVEPRRGVFGG